MAGNFVNYFHAYKNAKIYYIMYKEDIDFSTLCILIDIKFSFQEWDL